MKFDIQLPLGGGEMLIMKAFKKIQPSHKILTIIFFKFYSNFYNTLLQCFIWFLRLNFTTTGHTPARLPHCDPTF